MVFVVLSGIHHVVQLTEIFTMTAHVYCALKTNRSQFRCVQLITILLHGSFLMASNSCNIEPPGISLLASVDSNGSCTGNFLGPTLKLLAA